MGCSSTTDNTQLLKFPPTLNGITILPISVQKEKYFSIQQKFTAIMLNDQINKYLDQSIPENHVLLPKFIDDTYEKFYNEFKSQNMTNLDLRDSLLLKLLENQCEDFLDFKKINFQNLIIEIYENTEIEHVSFNKNDIINNFSLTSKRYFPSTQNYICLTVIDNPPEETQITKINNGQGLMKYAFENIKFNTKFPINLMTIILDDRMYKHEINLINIAEVINIRDSLNGVCINFSANKNLEYKISQNTKYIFEAIITNKSITALSVVGNEYNSCYILPQEVKNTLYKCIKINRFFAFCISKIKFTEQEIDELIKILLPLESLKFIVLDFDIIDSKIFKYIINNYLKKCKKILYCLIAGGNLDIDNEEYENEIKKSNSNFKYFAYAKYFNIFSD